MTGQIETNEQSRQCCPARAGNDSSPEHVGGRADPLAQRLPLRAVGLGPVLALDDGGLGVVEDAELHELGAARPRRRRLTDSVGQQVVDGAGVDGVLVERELRVLGDGLVGGLVAAGLEVDDDDLAVDVELEPVGVAGEPDGDLAAVGRGRVGHPHVGRELLLDGQHLARVVGVPPHEPGQRGPHPLVLARLRPRGAELQPLPHLVDVRHEAVDAGGRARPG